jgi:hypothetical protein
MSKKPNILRRTLNKTLNTLVLGVALFHGVSFVNNSLRDIKDRINPPAEYVTFEKTTGIKIGGYKSEHLNDDLFIFSNILREEQITPNELNKIIIEGPNYCSKSFSGQLSETILTKYSGYYSPKTNNIVMNGINARTLRHELVHARTNNLDNEEDLLREWSELAKDKNGKSYYMNLTNQALSRVRLLEKLVDKKSYSDNNLGFVSSYATTNVYEDIAEFVSLVSEDMYVFRTKYDKSPLFEKKLQLAVKYDLLPKELIEYSNVIGLFEHWDNWKENISNRINELKLHRETKGATSEFNFEKYLLSQDSLKNEFLIQSEKFLQNNSNSRFSNQLINYRADIYAKKGKMETLWTKESETELKRALALSNKGDDYWITLSRLSACQKQLHHKYDENNPYTCALIEYYQRRDNCDTTLFTKGVNDVLVRMGELKTISK